MFLRPTFRTGDPPKFAFLQINVLGSSICECQIRRLRTLIWLFAFFGPRSGISLLQSLR